MALIEAACPNCGAALKIGRHSRETVCQYCGSVFETTNSAYATEEGSQIDVHRSNISIQASRNSPYDSYSERLALLREEENRREAQKLKEKCISVYSELNKLAGISDLEAVSRGYITEAKIHAGEIPADLEIDDFKKYLMLKDIYAKCLLRIYDGIRSGMASTIKAGKSTRSYGLPRYEKYNSHGNGIVEELTPPITEVTVLQYVQPGDYRAKSARDGFNYGAYVKKYKVDLTSFGEFMIGEIDKMLIRNDMARGSIKVPSYGPSNKMDESQKVTGYGKIGEAVISDCKHLAIQGLGSIHFDVFAKPELLEYAQKIGVYSLSPVSRSLQPLNTCPYCGGQYVGIFTKKCSKCGRKKA